MPFPPAYGLVKEAWTDRGKIHLLFEANLSGCAGEREFFEQSGGLALA
jgi:hypothetical protein